MFHKITWVICLQWLSIIAVALPLDSANQLVFDTYKKGNYEQALQLLNNVESSNDQAELASSFLKKIIQNNLNNQQGSLPELKIDQEKLHAAGLFLLEAEAFCRMADIYENAGDVKMNLHFLLRALEIYQREKYPAGESAVYSSISLLYYDQNDNEEAFTAVHKALAIDQARNITADIQRDFNNLAIIFEHTNQPDSAIYYHKKSLELARKIGNKANEGLALSNLGNNYSMTGQYALAEKTLKEALQVRTEVGSPTGIAYTHNRLSYLYIEMRKLDKAQFHALQSLKYAKEAEQLKVTRMSYDRLAEIARLQGRVGDELLYYKKSVDLQDSILNAKNTKQITQMVMNYEFNRQQLLDSLSIYQSNVERENTYQKAILKERNQRNVFFFSGLVFLAVALGSYFRYRFIKRSRKRLEVEKKRSDDLLLNILPSEVAQELKEKGSAEARDFERVAVLFTDFKAFTLKASTLTAKALVNEINTCFMAFDEIVTRYNIEKIKTIGDAYMAAGGLPVANANALKNTVLAAIEMQNFMNARNKTNQKEGLPNFEMRVGIHAGPVVAGIVGVKKFQYDIWGDTVNTASRMESYGEVAEVNISEDTYTQIKNDPDFQFVPREEVNVKGKGKMKMYFVRLKKI